MASIWANVADPRALDFPLVASPTFSLVAVGVYLLFVKKIGVAWMEKREPFKINRLMIAYNAFQMLACGILTIIGLTLIPQMDDYLYEPVTHSYDHPYITSFLVVYGYYLLKLADFLDTIFFIMRKNFRQVTFLHVYHHAAMVLLIYLGVRYYGGGISVYFCTINNFVHVVMYGYYLLTVYDPQYKQSLWLKRNITHIQLVQFLTLVVLFLPSLFNPDCHYPKMASFLCVAQNSILFVLFSNFYYRTYIKTKKVA